MKKNDVSSQASEGKFNYRVGAIIMDSEKILMATNSGSNHYYTVGGRVKFGETAQEAVLREVLEEIKMSLEIERLAFIHENFFIWGEDKTPTHEIALFFLMKPNKHLMKMDFSAIKESYGEVSFHWLSIGELDKLKVYPDFLYDELKNFPKDILHLVTKGNITVRT